MERDEYKDTVRETTGLRRESNYSIFKKRQEKSGQIKVISSGKVNAFKLLLRCS